MQLARDSRKILLDDKSCFVKAGRGEEGGVKVARTSNLYNILRDSRIAMCDNPLVFIYGRQA